MAIVAVIGTGRMSGAFGTRFASQGDTVIYGSRNPADAKVQELVSKTGHGVSAASPREAAAKASVVVLGVPWAAAEETVKNLGDLAGKLVIDCTNGIRFHQGAMEMAVETSAGEMIQSWARGADVVKAFNTVGFFVIANPQAMDGPVACFLAGDKSEAKTRAAAIAAAFGFAPVDVGGMKNARVLEGMSILYMVPYLSGKRDQTFEWAVRGTGNRAGGTVRAAN